jgi:spore germination cell wall hydrolase CwlJ-like protein
MSTEKYTKEYPHVHWPQAHHLCNRAKPTATCQIARKQYNKEHRNIRYPQITGEHAAEKKQHPHKVAQRKDDPNPITTSKKPNFTS